MSAFDGSFEKKQRNKLGLKTALAALAIANAAPATAQQKIQTPNETQSAQGDVVSQEERNAIAAVAIPQIKEMREAARRSLDEEPNRDFGKMLQNRAQNVEAALYDPAYLAGLKRIQKGGGNIAEFIWLEPGRIKDRQQLESYLNRIPKELDGLIVLKTADLTEKPPYKYDREGLTDLAQRFASAGVRQSISDLNGVLDLEEKEKGASDYFIKLEQQSKGTLKVDDVLYYCKNGRMNLASFGNPEFLQHLIRFAEAGIKPGNLTSFDSSAEGRQKFEDRVSDDSFVKAVLALKKMGYESNSSSIDLPQEVYSSPFFLKNAEELRRVAPDASIGLMQGWDKAFGAEGLDEILAVTPKNPPGTIGSAISIGKQYVGNTETLRIIRAFVQKHPNRKLVIETMSYLSSSRVQNAGYMLQLEQQLDASSDDSNPFAIKSGLDDSYATNLLGKKAKDLQINEFTSILDNPESDPLLVEILSDYSRQIYVEPILRMNQLHEDTNAHRLSELKDLDSRNLFQVMITGGADAYLSTFRLVYNGNGETGVEAKKSFIARAVTEHGSLSGFFRAIRPDHKTFGTFLELLSQNNILDIFLSDIGSSEDQHSILREFLFDASVGINRAQALTLSDLLRATKAQPIREFVFGELRSVRERETDKSGKIAGLLIADYFQAEKDVPDWARASVQEYGKYFPEIRDLSEQAAFRIEGGLERNVQVQVFYDDRGPGKPESAWDGHSSFRSFITSLGGSVVWDTEGKIQRITVGRGYDLQDNGDYIVVRQVDNRTKREVVMYANKPDKNDETVARVDGELIKNERPQVIVHRGHSYHAGKTIRLIAPDTAMVNLGSCGGAKNISEVLAKAPSAQVMATRGVGTMLVNDAVARAFNGTLLRDGNVKWGTFGTQMTAEFKKRGGLAEERWGSYQMPDKNRIAHLIAALKAIEK